MPCGRRPRLIPVALFTVPRVATRVLANTYFSLLQKQKIMAYEIRFNSICNLPGHQKKNLHCARLNHDVNGFDMAMTVEKYCLKYFPVQEAVLPQERLFEDTSSPILPGTDQNDIKTQPKILLVETAGRTIHRIILETPSAARFRFYPRKDLLARLLIPQENDGRQRALLQTSDSMQITEEAHPLETNLL